MIPFTIITVAFIAAIFFTWFFIHKSREEERRLLIEKGVELSELPERGSFKFNFNFPWLKVGTVITSASIGLMIGVILIQQDLLDNGGEPLLGILIFGGIGMIIAHYLDKPNDKS